MQADPPVNAGKSPFQSFWMAGFECCDMLNRHGDRVDLLTLSGHDELIMEDYERIKQLNIHTVREGIRWSTVEYKPYLYDFSAVRKMILAGKACGVQQIWDICHFGYPDDLSPLHPHFTTRFVALCRSFANLFYELCPNDRLIVTPVNEVSFLSWLSGDVGGTAPYCRNNGWEVKYALMRAYIAGAKAIRHVHPGSRILTTEPLVNMVPADVTSELEIELALAAHEQQYQSVDMLCGKICPELGGNEDLLDILGFNYYYNNQWIAGKMDLLGWNDPVPDFRWRPLSSLLKEAHQRYNKPVVVTETSHPGIDRPLWIRMIGREATKVLAEKIPLWGICLYPVIDRPDWDYTDSWHRSGIWDHDDQVGCTSRVLHEPSRTALLHSQQLVSQSIIEARPNPALMQADQPAPEARPSEDQLTRFVHLQYR